MKEIRPRLTDDWTNLIDTIRDLGVSESLRRIEEFHGGKTVFDSKNDTIEIKGKRVKTLQDLLEVAEVDLQEWRVDNHVVNKWEVGAKDAEGNIVIEPLYQVKAWLKRRGFAAPDNTWTEVWLKNLTSKLKRQTPHVQPKKGKVLNVVIADLHLGVVHEGIIDSGYNKVILSDRLNKIAAIANEHDGPVNVFCLGDVIESFTGKNKPNTWKSIEMHGAEVALHAYDLLERLFASIPNFNTCYFVGGNHDRITDTSHEDNQGQVLDIINGIFERMGRFETIFDSTLLTVDVDGLHYILTHGDKKISKMTAEKFVVNYGKPYIYNVILSAHFHHSQVIDQGPMYTKRVVPPIVSQTAYEFISGYVSSPGFLTIQAHGDKPKITEYPF